MAFLVGFGVLLDTFVVRSLVVPSAVALIGDRVWWPSRLARRPTEQLRSATRDDSPATATSPAHSA
jgi:RND superfamily putative drug exporter